MIATLRNFWRRLRGAIDFDTRARRGRPTAFRPQVEGLEERMVMSGQPLTAIPVLHSKPGAAVAIYLDFNGHYDRDWWGVPDDGNPANDVTRQVADDNGNLINVTVRRNSGPNGSPP